MFEKIEDWVISREAAKELVEPSTTRVRSPDRTVKPHERGAGMYKKVTGIYAIRHEATDSIYYGSAVCTSGRINMHKRELRNNEHSNSFLQRMFNKYGSELKFEVIEECDRSELRIKEQAYIDNCKIRLMNLDLTVCELQSSEQHSTRMKGAWKNRTPEQVKAMASKISNTLKRKYQDEPEALKKAQDALVKARASDAMKQNKHSAEANEKRSKGTKADWGGMSQKAKKARAKSISDGMKVKTVKQCNHCEEVFTGTNPVQKYCNPDCRMDAFKVRHA